MPDIDGTVPMPPMPADKAEYSRWTHTRLRRRMLDGGWQDDLVDEVQQHVGSIREEAWRPVKPRSCPFAAISRELATLYVAPPDVRHDIGREQIRPLVDALAASGWWAMAPRYQAWVIGCREYLGRMSYRDGLVIRPVPPDLVVGRAHQDRPTPPT